MKIAIFHSFMDNIGGAERVCLILARELKADIYTTNVDREKIRKMGFPEVKIISLGKVPLNAPLRHQMALWKFRKLNLKRQYDFYIIGGDWAISAAVNHKPNLWYAHSPIREIWDLYAYTRKNIVPAPFRPAYDVWVRYNQGLNRKYVRETDHIFCNSRNTQHRIKKYLSNESRVLHPPIETAKFYYRENGHYWLSVNRLISHKRVEMQINAFAKLPEEKLVIVGCYEQSRHFKTYAKYIQSIKPKNVEIVSWIDQEKLVELYSNCKGFITTAIDEDFGMTPVEAMASGKPVIAPNEGGYKETVVDRVTGRLVDAMDEHKLISAIKDVGADAPRFRESCFKRAQEFDTANFIKPIKDLAGV